MSLPIYLTPFRKDIIAELKQQGYDEKTIIAVITNFKGRKCEEELLKFLKSIRGLNVKSETIIDKAKEILKQWDVTWGYIIDKDGCEVYQPKLYKK